jgi:nucleotide-binding universal stress UspA family protein
MSTNPGIIVVGVDGSPDSASAITWAEQFAVATGATLRLVTAWQWAIAYGAPMMFEGYQPQADAQAVADKARTDISLPDDRVEIVIVEGSAGPALVDASEGASTLVVGSRGHGVVSKILVGSVSSYCVHHATCPVVVVR